MGNIDRFGCAGDFGKFQTCGLAPVASEGNWGGGEKMLQMMFSVQVPTNKDKFKNKHVLTYFHWYGASSALKWNLMQMDVNTGQWFSPTDFNSWVMPLSGKIWDAYNFTMCFFVKRKRKSLFSEGKFQTTTRRSFSQSQRTRRLSWCTSVPLERCRFCP